MKLETRNCSVTIGTFVAPIPALQWPHAQQDQNPLRPVRYDRRPLRLRKVLRALPVADGYPSLHRRLVLLPGLPRGLRIQSRRLESSHISVLPVGSVLISDCAMSQAILCALREESFKLKLGHHSMPPYLRGICLAWRWRAALAPAGPVPVGGLRIPFSRSLRTTALLRTSFFEANNKVSGFL